MQITLNQDEITTAVEDYLNNQINIAEGQEISIDFTAGRGPNGLTAAIDIRSASATAAEAPKKTTPKVVETVESSTLTKPKVVVEEAKSDVQDEPEVAAPQDEDPAPVTKASTSIFSKANKVG